MGALVSKAFKGGKRTAGTLRERRPVTGIGRSRPGSAVLQPHPPTPPKWIAGIAVAAADFGPQGRNKTERTNSPGCCLSPPAAVDLRDHAYRRR